MSHQQIFYGDTLRTILSFVESHRELAQLRSASRLLLIESNKSIIWPRQLIEISITSPGDLRRHAESSHIVDLVRGIDLRQFEPRHELSVEQLTRFTQLRSIQLNLEYRVVASGDTNRERKVYESRLIDWFTTAGATIEKVNINIGTVTYDYERMWSLLTAMTHLRINHKSDNLYFPVWVYQHSGITPQACPSIREIVIDLDWVDQIEPRRHHGPQFGSSLNDEIYRHYRNLTARFAKSEQPPHIQIRARAANREADRFDLSLALIEAAIEWQCVHLTSISLMIMGDGTFLPREEQVQRYLIAYRRLCELQHDDRPQLNVCVPKALNNFLDAMSESIIEFWNRSLTPCQQQLIDGCVMQCYTQVGGADSDCVPASQSIFIWWETDSDFLLGTIHFNENIVTKQKTKVDSQSLKVDQLLCGKSPPWNNLPENECFSLISKDTSLHLRAENEEIRNVWMNGIKEIIMKKRGAAPVRNTIAPHWIAVRMSAQEFAYITPLLIAATTLEVTIDHSESTVPGSPNCHSLGPVISQIHAPSRFVIMFHERLRQELRAQPQLYKNTPEMFMKGLNQTMDVQQQAQMEQVKDEPEPLDYA